ncbi:MAG: ubiquitin [Clostridiales Family XIII bacterium]|jgi:hypothetical protein|nr:ubiquitin [Clostridiales Family XIII bacterium]
MSITIEQVEQLTSRTGVSYAEAKAALEAADGDLLEALIALERDGKTTHKSATYSTNEATPESYTGSGRSNEGGQGNNDKTGNYEHGAKQGGTTEEYSSRNDSKDREDYKQGTDGFGEMLNKLWKGFLRLFHRGNINHFEVFQRGNRIISIPTTVLVLLLIFGFWFVLPALLIGLFFGCRYRFRGPDLGREDINRVMDSAGETAENLKQSMKDTAEEYTKEEQ